MSQLFAFLIVCVIAAGEPQKESSQGAVTPVVKQKGHKMTVSEVLTKNTEKWMRIPGVLGTGEGKHDGKPCVMIFVENNVTSVKKQIPGEVEGYKVVFETTGPIKASQK